MVRADDDKRDAYNADHRLFFYVLKTGEREEFFLARATHIMLSMSAAARREGS
jgi:hypothetical protein